MDKEFWLKLIEINPKYKKMLKTNSSFYMAVMYLSRGDFKPTAVMDVVFSLCELLEKCENKGRRV